MVKCPKCGANNTAPKKEWYYGPKFDPKRMRVQLFRCRSCTVSFSAWIRPDKIAVSMLKGRGRRRKT